MHRKRAYLVLCIFLFLVSTINVNTIPNVSAQTTLQTFERNPLSYWNVTDEITATYHSNNTVSISSNQLKSWYNSDWDKRKIIYLTGSNGAGINYQIKINVTYDNDMQTDFDDIIFTDNDKKTLLDYYLEVKIDSSWALFWVEIKDSLNTNTIIYMYYDNPAVSSLSNGEKTFLFFDDFENDNLDRWDHVGAYWSTTSSRVYRGTYSGYGQSGAESNDRRLIKNLSGFSDIDMMIHMFIQHDLETDKEFWFYGNGTSSGANSYPLIGENNNWKYDNGPYADWETNTYLDDTWFEIDLAFDYTNSLFRLWIDNISKGSQDLEDINGVDITSISMWQIITDTGTLEDIWFDDCYIRKWTLNEPYYNSTGSEITYNEVPYDEGYIDIPLMDSKDIKIKTMVEQNTFVNNEAVVFSLISDLGEISNLMFTLNETYDYRIRVEYGIKKIVNVYRLILNNEYQVQISRQTETFIISKNLISLRMRFVNYTSTTRLNMFFMSGDLDYTHDFYWIETILESSPLITTYSYQNIEMESVTSVTDSFAVNYDREIHNFQYIRTFFDISYENALTTDRIAKVYSEVTFRIDNLYIEIGINLDTTTIMGEKFDSYVLVSIWPRTTDYIYEFYSDNAYAVEPSMQTSNTFKVWRTLDDSISIGFGSDSELFHSEYDTRRNPETEFTYWTYNKTLNQFNGSIRFQTLTTHINDGSSTLRTKISFPYLEYDFNADYGIAEPTFSSTWFGIFPFNIISDWLLSTFTSDWDMPEFASDFFEIFTGVGESVADFLSPLFGDVGIILGNVWDTIVEVGGNIVDTVGDIIGDIGLSIAEWGETMFITVVAILMDVADTIASFLYWFINAIGELLGVTNLAGTIAELIVNFGIAIANFIGGIVLVFSLVGDGFGFVLTIITSYLPTVLTFATILILLHVGTALASADDTKIMNMIGVYARIFEKILGIFYAVANMVIQFIGGIIP